MKLNAGQNVLEFQNVGLQISSDNTLFRNLTFKIPKNSSCLLLGPTGSGKSTILKMIKGLIPYIIPFKVTGTISVLNQIKDYKNYIQQSLDIGLLLQDVEMQFIGSTVLQDLAFGLENLDIPKKKMINLISTFENNYPLLQKVKNRTPWTLSGGELSVIEFLSTIITQPQLLLCDEPLKSLDHLSRTQFLTYLSEFTRNNTCVIATHTVEPFLDFINYVVALDVEQKCIAFQGSLDNFLNHIHEFKWLELPLMKEIDTK